jgi:hypothetical protein
MLKQHRNIVLGIFFITMFSSFSLNTGNEVPEGIITSFKTGNAKELAKFFNSSIQLILLEKENLYSKEQAQQVLQNFFATHAPKNLTIIHEGGKDESKFAIGTLTTNNGIYRVTIYLKLEKNQLLIHKLIIENETND